MKREDPLVLVQLAVTAEKVGGRRLRCARERRVALQPAVELVGGDVDAVLEALVAEEDVERDDAPVGEAVGRVGEVSGRVEDDRRVLCGQVHGAAASTIAATIASSS